MDRSDLDKRLINSFVEGASCPIEPASLEALSDMGMSVKRIAQYLSVSPAAVRALSPSAATTVAL
jgi:hypothetical protein